MLYSFQGGTDGFYPKGGLLLDGSGNLYGTTEYGGANGYGTVFELIHGTDEDEATGSVLVHRLRHRSIDHLYRAVMAGGGRSSQAWKVLWM